MESLRTAKRPSPNGFQQQPRYSSDAGSADSIATRSCPAGAPAVPAKRRREVQGQWGGGEGEGIKVLEDDHIEQMIEELLHCGSVELCFM